MRSLLPADDDAQGMRIAVLGGNRSIGYPVVRRASLRECGTRARGELSLLTS